MYIITCLIGLIKAPLRAQEAEVAANIIEILGKRGLLVQ